MFEAYYSQLNTPCLVVDEPMTRENIKRMQQVADAIVAGRFGTGRT